MHMVLLEITGLMGHIFIVFEVALVAYIINKQWYYFKETKARIDEFMDSIPESEYFRMDQYELSVQVLKNEPPISIIRNIEQYNELYDPNSEYATVTIVEEKEVHSPLFNTIRDSLNTYLLRNKGAVADFNLIKDITERNTNAVEQDINITLPTPLYLGLMGTMSGIVVGLLIFVAKVSITATSNTEGGEVVDYMSGINELLIGVCIGMFASAFGLGLTVYNSVVKFKGAKSLVESRKNDFYTFIQTELLPILSQNINTGFHNLQMNLMNFNQEFSGNLQKLEGMMSKNNEALIAQSRIIDNLEKVNINEFVKANIVVFSELKSSIDSLKQFNQYIGLLNGFVEKSSSLNSKILELLDRSDNLEAIADEITNNMQENKKLTMFLNTHFNVLEDHGRVINDSVGKIDNLMARGFTDLQDNIKSNVHTLIDFSHKERDKLQEVMRENRTSLANLQYLEALDRHLLEFKKSTDENNRVFQTNLIESLTALKMQMNTLIKEQQKNGGSLFGFIKNTLTGAKK